MEYDEDPHQQRPCQGRQRQCDPPGDAQAEIHEIPEHGIGADRIDDLPRGSPETGLLVIGKDRLPRRHLLPTLGSDRSRVLGRPVPRGFCGIQVEISGFKHLQLLRVAVDHRVSPAWPLGHFFPLYVVFGSRGEINGTLRTLRV